MNSGPAAGAPRLVVATGNRGKLRELEALLGGLGLGCLAQSALGVVEAEETGATFVENAIIKARNAARQTGLPALADDSGLEVDALAGEPGVYSALYAGPGAGDSANNALLLERLAGVPPEARTARFVCVMVYLGHAGDPRPLIAEGLWEGRVALAPLGAGGFGYDPLFLPSGLEASAAELEPALKNTLSHRGQALRGLVDKLRARLAAGGARGTPPSAAL